MTIYDEISVIEKSCKNKLYFVLQTESKTGTMTVKMPNQTVYQWIVCGSSTGKTFDTINPADETVSITETVNLFIFLAEIELILRVVQRSSVLQKSRCIIY